MAVNLAIAAAKAAGGVCFASQALLADAVHSLSDLVTDAAVVLGVKFWIAPADEDHPYGHGKIETLVTAFIALALFAVAGKLVWNAAECLHSPSAQPPEIWAAWFAAASILAKEILYRWTAREATRIGSSSLAANAWHHRSDAISSAPVAAAVAIAHFFPALHWVDSAGAILVAAFIARAAWKILKPTLEELSEKGAGDVQQKLASIAARVPGVTSVHKARARRIGSAVQADLHVRVDGSISVTAGHHIGHAVEDAILNASLGVLEVTIHVEPEPVPRLSSPSPSPSV